MAHSKDDHQRDTVLQRLLNTPHKAKAPADSGKKPVGKKPKTKPSK